MIYDLKLAAVYHYRNRWVLGEIKGQLDLKNRKFIPNGRKIGRVSITQENKKSAQHRFRFENYISLQKYLAKMVLVDMDTSDDVEKESKYIERLILNATNCKKIWVDKTISVRMFPRKEVYPHIANQNTICSTCKS